MFVIPPHTYIYNITFKSSSRMLFFSRFLERDVEETSLNEQNTLLSERLLNKFLYDHNKLKNI